MNLTESKNRLFSRRACPALKIAPCHIYGLDDILICMKTTVEIPDAVFRQAKAEAARRGVPLKTVIETALREHLAGGKKNAKPHKYRRHIFRGEGLQEGLSWGDWETIRNMIYEGRGG